jgi:hypothetical protein
MNTILVSCGFLGKSAGYYYTVQDIKLHNSGWSKVDVLHDNKVISTFINNNNELSFQMKQDNSYNIFLEIFQSFGLPKNIITKRELFSYELKIYITVNNMANVYTLSDGLIVDH